MKLGVISDTHNFFDPRLPDFFSGVDHILHAGDIGNHFIILQLEQIAPVTAVLGNNDSDLPFRETEVITLAERKFLLHHIVNPASLSAIAARVIANATPDVVIFGHSHQRHESTVGGILYFNPGYAGKVRFGQPRSIALLHCSANTLRSEFITL